MIVNSLFVMEFLHKWTYFYVGKPVESTTVELTKYNFAKLVLDSNDTWLVQAYSNASPNSHKFVHIWNRAGKTVLFDFLDCRSVFEFMGMRKR
jgi:hypothetical protein